LCMLAIVSALAAGFALLPSVALSLVTLTAFLTFGLTIGVAAIAVSNVVLPAELRGFNMAITIVAAAVFAIGVAPLAVSTVSALLGGRAAIAEALTIVCAGTSLLSAVAFGFARRFFPADQAEHAPL
jgi:hypothetical protein